MWSPIDYIPTFSVIENVIKSDLFITMTPIIIPVVLFIRISLVDTKTDVKCTLHLFLWISQRPLRGFCHSRCELGSLRQSS